MEAASLVGTTKYDLRSRLLKLGDKLNRVLRHFGVVVLPTAKLKDRKHLIDDCELPAHHLLRLNGVLTGGLRGHLLDNQKTRWLEIGCAGTLEEGFYYVDTFPEGVVDRSFRNRYTRLDVVNATPRDLEKLGTFDLVRMQHVFEHFSPEDGARVLEKCASLLNPGGYLLITTPDLRIHAKAYLESGYKNNPRMESFNRCAHKRVAPDAPGSFYFSIFTHSLLYERHQWCYDFEGLRYLLSQTRQFDVIQELDFNHPLASFPFTHNRPEEDVCVLARKKES